MNLDHVGLGALESFKFSHPFDYNRVYIYITVGRHRHLLVPDSRLLFRSRFTSRW